MSLAMANPCSVRSRARPQLPLQAIRLPEPGRRPARVLERAKLVLVLRRLGEERYRLSRVAFLQIGVPQVGPARRGAVRVGGTRQRPLSGLNAGLPVTLQRIGERADPGGHALEPRIAQGVAERPGLGIRFQGTLNSPRPV